MAGMGFDAAIMAGARHNMKARWGSLAYVVAGMRALSGLRADITLAVDRRINLVCQAIVALISLESAVMRSCDAPKRPAINFKWRFPNSQMISRHSDSYGFRVGESIILRPAKEKERAHGHRQQRQYYE